MDDIHLEVLVRASVSGVDFNDWLARVYVDKYVGV